MTHVLNIGPSERSRDLAGIACVVIGMVFFVGQDALMKALLGPYTIWLLMAVRGAVAALVLVPFLVTEVRILLMPPAPVPLRILHMAPMLL